MTRASQSRVPDKLFRHSVERWRNGTDRSECWCVSLVERRSESNVQFFKTSNQSRLSFLNASRNRAVCRDEMSSSNIHGRDITNSTSPARGQ